MPRNLIIVRAGDQSLHTGWLANPNERAWDVIVNYYGDNPDLYHDQGQIRIDSKGPKWPALHQLVNDHWERIQTYDYVWFPDDDLVSDAASVNKFFALCAEFALDLAQPSLTLDSIIGHPITVTNHAFLLRYTTFVEIMAPCFSQRFLQRCRSSFNTNISGWGLDFLWPSWAESLDKVAIVDAVAVRHTRSRGALYGLFKEQGITPEQELAQLVLKEKLRPIQMTVGAVDLEKQTHGIWNNGHKKLIQLLLAGYLPELANHPEHLYRAIEPLFAFMGQNDATAKTKLTAVK